MDNLRTWTKDMKASRKQIDFKMDRQKFKKTYQFQPRSKGSRHDVAFFN